MHCLWHNLSWPIAYSALQCSIFACSTLYYSLFAYSVFYRSLLPTAHYIITCCLQRITVQPIVLQHVDIYSLWAFEFSNLSRDSITNDESAPAVTCRDSAEPLSVQLAGESTPANTSTVCLDWISTSAIVTESANTPQFEVSNTACTRMRVSRHAQTHVQTCAWRHVRVRVRT